MKNTGTVKKLYLVEFPSPITPEDREKLLASTTPKLTLRLTDNFPQHVIVVNSPSAEFISTLLGRQDLKFSERVAVGKFPSIDEWVNSQ